MKQVKILSEGIRPPNEKQVVALLYDDAIPEARQIVIYIQAGFDATDHVTANFDALWTDGLTANEAWTAQLNQIDDSSERTALLDAAAAALTQITNDQTAIGNGKTALVAATTLAQVKPIVDGMLDILGHICTRQEREIKVLRAIVRSGLD